MKKKKDINLEKWCNGNEVIPDRPSKWEFNELIDLLINYTIPLIKNFGGAEGKEVKSNCIKKICVLSCGELFCYHLKLRTTFTYAHISVPIDYT